MTVGGADSGAKRAAKPIAALPPAQARAKRSYPRSCGTTKVMRFQHAKHAAQAAGVVLIIVLSGERRRKACPGGDSLCCQRRSRQCAGGCELREEGTTPLGNADLQGRRAADGQSADETCEHCRRREENKKCRRQREFQRTLPRAKYLTYAAENSCGFAHITCKLHARRAELGKHSDAARKQHAHTTWRLLELLVGSDVSCRLCQWRGRALHR